MYPAHTKCYTTCHPLPPHRSHPYLQRVLPGPSERAWQHLTDAGLRRQWLAVCDGVQPRAGTSFELVWRNDELTDPPGKHPDGFADEQRMQSRIIECDPPRRLAFT